MCKERNNNITLTLKNIKSLLHLIQRFELCLAIIDILLM